MTGIGEQARVYGEFSNIPNKFQAAIRAGINFFELRTNRPIFFDRQINGPFSVSAREDFDTIAQKTQYIVDWQTGDRAAIRFEVVDSKTGLAKAFVPDDRFWHNRIVICDNVSLQGINAYHTREGMFPGAVLLEEINILYQIITVAASEFCIVNAVGRPISAFPSKEAAQTELAENKFKNHTIIEREIRVKSPRVMNMIKNWHTNTRSRYGWTDCPEFNEIKEEVKDKLAKRHQTTPQVVTPNLSPEQLDLAIISAIRRMPIEERKKLIESTTTNQVKETVFDGKTPHTLTTPQLKAKALEYGIRVTAKATRRSLTRALREKGFEVADAEALEGREVIRNQDAPQPEPKVPEEEEIVR